jgi:PAS domain S-box-containing protein
MEKLTELAAADRPLVVVVDDDEDTRLNLCDILELDGYRVEVAGTAGALLSRTTWDDVALVLLDRKLPDGTPEQLLPLIEQKAPHAAVIIVTGYADIEGAISALRGGAADYILKPVNAGALRASVQRVLAQQQAQREIARLSQEVASGQERYRALFENTLDGQLILDNQQQIVDCNPAAAAKLGYEPAMLRGQKLDTLMPAGEERERADLWTSFFGGGKQVGECRLSRRDAAIIDVEYRAVENIAPGLHLLSIHDITARKRAEARMRQAERLAAVGETMAGLVHESRNALQRSKACLEMLAMEVEDRPAALDLVARAQRAQDDLQRLYEEVRQWAAPLHLRREPCDLRDLWTEVWTHVRQARPERAARLKEHVTGDTTCECDCFAMAQVFRNIFENAIEASPEQGEVTVRCKGVHADNGNEICITIADQGRGLSAEEQARIFEPFFTTKAKGTGLGMAIVQRIVQSHGGAISARSEGGAQIEVTLPRGAP